MADAPIDQPLGLTHQPPPAPAGGVAIPPENPAVGARALFIGGRLMAGATTFFFLAFVFAYFYLRSLNEQHLWRPPKIHPVQALGVVFLLCVLLSAGLAYVAKRMMSRSQSAWASAAAGSVLLGVVAIVIQCIEWVSQNFGPTDGGYASVFVGWTAFYLFFVIGALYWLETHVATEIRARRTPAHSHGDIARPDELIRPGLDAAVFYWGFVAGIGALTYVVLYLL